MSDIRDSVRPQLEEIERELRQTGDIDRDLPRIAVRAVYIKRRSNMELLSADGSITGDELVSAAAETSEYLKLAGVDAAFSFYGTGSYAPDTVISAYEDIHRFIEMRLTSMKRFMVVFRFSDGGIEMRIMSDPLPGEEMERFREVFPHGRTAGDAPGEDDFIAMFSYRDGGDQYDS